MRREQTLAFFKLFKQSFSKKKKKKKTMGKGIFLFRFFGNHIGAII